MARTLVELKKLQQQRIEELERGLQGMEGNLSSKELKNFQDRINDLRTFDIKNEKDLNSFIDEKYVDVAEDLRERSEEIEKYGGGKVVQMPAPEAEEEPDDKDEDLDEDSLDEADEEDLEEGNVSEEPEARKKGPGVFDKIGTKSAVIFKKLFGDKKSADGDGGPDLTSVYVRSNEPKGIKTPEGRFSPRQLLNKYHTLRKAEDKQRFINNSSKTVLGVGLGWFLMGMGPATGGLSWVGGSIVLYGSLIAYGYDLIKRNAARTWDTKIADGMASKAVMKKALGIKEKRLRHGEYSPVEIEEAQALNRVKQDALDNYEKTKATREAFRKSLEEAIARKAPADEIAQKRKIEKEWGEKDVAAHKAAYLDKWSPVDYLDNKEKDLKKDLKKNPDDLELQEALKNTKVQKNQIMNVVSTKHYKDAIDSVQKGKSVVRNVAQWALTGGVIIVSAVAIWNNMRPMWDVVSNPSQNIEGLNAGLSGAINVGKAVLPVLVGALGIKHSGKIGSALAGVLTGNPNSKIYDHMRREANNLDLKGAKGADGKIDADGEAARLYGNGVFTEKVDLRYAGVTDPKEGLHKNTWLPSVIKPHLTSGEQRQILANGFKETLQDIGGVVNPLRWISGPKPK